MLTPAAKHQLKVRHRAQIDGRAVAAKSVAGLLVLVGLALIGLSTDPDELRTSTAALSAPRGATGR